MYGAHRQTDAALADFCDQRSVKRLGSACPGCAASAEQGRAGRAAPYFDIQLITAW